MAVTVKKPTILTFEELCRRNVAPVLRADSNWVKEDGPINAQGNLLKSLAHGGAPFGSFADRADTDANGNVLKVTTTGTFLGKFGILTLKSNGSYTYKLYSQAQKPGAFATVQGLSEGETLTESFKYKATDGFVTRGSVLKVTIFGTDDPVTISNLDNAGGEAVVDEGSLPAGSLPDASGLTKTGFFNISAPDGFNSLTVGGVVIVTNGAVTNIGTPIPTASGILTITGVDLVTGKVTFSFTLNDNTLAHGPANDGKDSVLESLAVVLKDVDGSTATASLDIRIIDDVPSIEVCQHNAAIDPCVPPSPLVVDETDFGTNATSNFAGAFISDFGADGPGTIAYSLDTSAGQSGLVDTLSGEPVVVAKEGDDIVGRAGPGGPLVFVILVDAVTGTVTLDQQRAVFHDPNFGPDDVKGLPFDLVAVTATITDADGDQTTATLNAGGLFGFLDDAPDANDDGTFNIAEDNPFTANVLANDTLSADGPTVVVNAVLTLGAGLVSFLPNGDVTFDPAPGFAGPATITYTIEDADGDQSTAILTVIVDPDSVPQVRQADNAIVDEDGLPGANVDSGQPGETDANELAITTGNIVVDFGNDVPASLISSIALVDTAALDGQLTTLAGDTVAFALEGGMLVGRPAGGGAPVVTIEVTAAIAGPGASEVTYTYQVTLHQPILHASSTSEDSDVLNDITFQVTDLDGTITQGTFAVEIVDDIPVALNDGQAATEGGAAVITTAATGVLSNDAIGADLPGTVTAVAGGTIGVAFAGAFGTLTLNADGSYTYTPNASVPAGSIDSFTYTVRDADGDTGTAVLSFTFAGDNNHATAGTTSARVDEDDLPAGNGDLAPGDDAPAGSPGVLPHNYGLDGPGHIALVAGSQTINGVLYTYTVNAAGTLLTANDGTQDVFTVTLTNAVTGAFTVALLAPVEHLGSTPGFEDNLDVTLGYQVFDADDATGVAGSLTLTIDDDIPVALNDGQAATEGGAAVITTAATGVLSNDAIGADLPGTVTAVAGGTIGVAFAGAFGTLTLNADGSYTYTPNASVPAGSIDSFTYTVRDADGDTGTAVLSFTFAGDNNHATAGTTSARVDEDDLPAGNGDLAPGDDAPAGSPGVLPHNYGLDGPGHIALVAGSQTINGVLYTYTVNAAGTLLTANDGTQDVFTVTLTNAVTGAFTVALLAPVEHLGSTPGFEDNLDVTLGYQVFDADDATGVAGSLTLTIDDDIPVALNDGQAATEGGAAVITTAATGVLSNDAIGADLPGTVTAVAGGTIGVAFAGAFGTLTLNADGSYTYTPNASVPAGSIDSFTYTVRDADGDTGTAVLSFTFAGDNNHATAGTTSARVDEDDLPAGNGDLAPGDDAPAGSPGVLPHNYGLDGPGHIALVAGSQTINGVLYTYTVNAAGTLLTANDGTQDVFTVTLTNAVTGAFTVALLAPVEHLGSTPGFEDNLDVTLGYQVFDADDATGVAGSLTLTIDDDIPVALNDGQAATEGGAAIVTTAATGVLSNDAIGADLPGTVTAVAGGTIGVAFAGAFGTLTLNADGSYAYTPNASVPAGSIDSFTYTVRDADGDTGTAVLSFTFAGDNNHATAGTTSARVDEDDLPAGNGDLAPGDDAPAGSPGVLPHNYGLDGPGHIALVAGSQTINGVLYTYSVNAAGTLLTANDGTQDVFTVTLTNAVTGAFTVALLAPVEHLGSTPGFEDNLDVTLGYQVFDADDATGVAGSLTLTIDDDIPVALNDGQAATEGGAAIVTTAATGVLSNDAIGADLPGTVTAVAGGTIGVAFAGAFGTLTLNADGSYAYTPNASVPAGSIDSFTYTVRDADGDTGTAVLSFTFAGDNNHATAGTTSARVDEDDLPAGNGDLAPGDDAPAGSPGVLPHNYGLDGPGHIALVAGSQTINGVLYTYSVNAAGTLLTANDGTQDVFTVTLTNAVTGAFTVALLAPVEHLGSTPGFEDNLDVTLGYQVFDADDATGVAGSLTLTIDDDIPVVPLALNLAVALTIDETDGVAANANEIDPPGGDLGTATIAASSYLVSASSFGADGPGSVSFNISINSATPTGLFDTATGLQIVLDSQSATVINGLAGPGGPIVFTISIDPATGNLTMTQLRAILHDDPSDPDESTSPAMMAHAALNVTKIVIDGDGDQAINSISIGSLFRFEDAGPATVAPDTETLTNAAGSASNGSLPLPHLDSDGNIDDNAGADQPGTIAFTNITNGQVLQGIVGASTVDLASGGQTIQLFRVDHDANASTPAQLQGWTGGLNTGTKILQITLTPDGSLGASNDTYNVELFQQIGATVTTTVNNTGFATAGNKEFNVIDVAGTPEDLLFSAFVRGPSGSLSSGTVNTNSTSVGVNNQSMNDGESLRIDFVTSPSVTGTPQNTYNYAAHYNVSEFTFAIVQKSGGTGVDAIEVWLRAYDADNDDPSGTSNAQHQTEITDFTAQLAITSIQVNGVALSLATLQSDGNGGYLVTGLDLNDQVSVGTATGFNRLEIENAVSLTASPDPVLNGDSFDIGQFAIVNTTTSIPSVEMDFDLVLADGDGDSSVTAGAIHVTLTPAVAPVAIDLDGDGLEFLPKSSGTAFDYFRDGTPEATSWIGSDDGLLVIDTNGDGIVNDISELAFAQITDAGDTDLEALAAVFDTNGDGILSHADDRFGELGVWQDANSNGVTDLGELVYLMDLGIASLTLTSDGVAYVAAEGDIEVHGQSTYTRIDGSTGILGDVSLGATFV